MATSRGRKMSRCRPYPHGAPADTPRQVGSIPRQEHPPAHPPPRQSFRPKTVRARQADTPVILIPMRHKDGIDMVHVIADQRAHHALIEPTVHERHCAALADKNRIGLANIEDRNRRRSESIPVDVRNRSQEHQACKPHRHRTCTGTRPPDQQSRQQTRHQVNPHAIGRHAHGCTRHAANSCSKNNAHRAAIMGTTSAQPATAPRAKREPAQSTQRAVDSPPDR